MTYYDDVPLEVMARGGELDGCHIAMSPRDFDTDSMRWLTYRMPDGEIVGDWYLLTSDESGCHASWRAAT